MRLQDYILGKALLATWRGIRLAFRAVVSAVDSFDRHDTMTLAAALAFYTSLSLAPALVLIFWVANWVPDWFGTDLQTVIHEQLEKLIDEPKALKVLETAIQHAIEQPIARSVAGVLSLAFVLFASTTAFSHIRASLNQIWDVEVTPGRTIVNFFRARLLSLLMLFAFGALLIFSLVVSTTTNVIISQINSLLPEEDLLWLAGRVIPPMLVFWLLFAAMFRVLPDVKLSWRSVLVGSAVTALLFSLGKALLSLYFSRVAPGSAYGAAGSLLALLLWIYYSSIIIFFGAELTHAWQLVRGKRFEPTRSARWKKIPSWEQQGPPSPKGLARPTRAERRRMARTSPPQDEAPPEPATKEPSPPAPNGGSEPPSADPPADDRPIHPRDASGPHSPGM